MHTLAREGRCIVHERAGETRDFFLRRDRYVGSPRVSPNFFGIRSSDATRKRARSLSQDRSVRNRRQLSSFSSTRAFSIVSRQLEARVDLCSVTNLSKRFRYWVCGNARPSVADLYSSWERFPDRPFLEEDSSSGGESE